MGGQSLVEVREDLSNCIGWDFYAIVVLCMSLFSTRGKQSPLEFWREACILLCQWVSL